MIYKNAIITLFSVLTIFAASFSASAQQTRSAAWLDRPLVNWNRAAGGLPQLPRTVAAPGAADNRCLEQIRQPETAAERVLAQRGWRLYGATQSFGQTRVATALSGFDPMCRPLGFQAFVYREGRYAGTLAPAAMDSRADGALTEIRLVSPTVVSAEFVRYASSDALCCPSKISRVTYNLRRADAPDFAPVNVTTDAACQMTGQTENSSGNDTDSLFGRRWVLTQIGNQRVSSGRPFVEFNNREKRVSGDAGCNIFSGGFEMSDAALKFSNVASTMRACADAGANRIETRFLQTLDRVTGFAVAGDTLRLYAGSRRNNPLLVFRADSADGAERKTASVTGTVTYLPRIALSPKAVIEVKLLDVSRADAPSITIAKQTIESNGRQVPFSFQLPYDPSRINPRRRYAVQARILENGRLRFTTTRSYPVITNGSPNTVEVIVNPVR